MSSISYSSAFSWALRLSSPSRPSFNFIVATVLSLAHSHDMASGFTMGLREITFPSLSEAFFHDALEYLHFSGNLLYLLPEKVDLADLLPKCILVRFSESAQFIQ